MQLHHRSRVDLPERNRHSKPTAVWRQRKGRFPLGHDDGFAIFLHCLNLQPARQRLITESDLRDSLMIVGEFAAASVLPISAMVRFGNWIASLRMERHKSKKLEKFHDSIASVLGLSDRSSTARLFEQFRQHRQRFRLLVALELTPWRKSPCIEVSGAELLQKARSEGRGAIVWTDNLIYQKLITKKALRQCGFDVYQLITREHGYSQSAFGINFLNKPLIRAERRNLIDHVVLSRDEELTIARRLFKLLSEGHIVVIGNNTVDRTSLIELPFGKKGFIRMPTTALRIAARHAIPLFSLSGCRNGAAPSVPG